jgi:hypothetical protein
MPFPRWAPSQSRLDFLCIAIAIVATGFGALFYSALVGPDFRPYLGHDLAVYQNAALRWLNGDGFYLMYTLAGPYPLGTAEILYPPVMLLVLVPSLFLPAVLWWIIPLSITAAVIVRHHPAPWAIAVIAISLALVPSVEIVGSGNPAMWIGAALALATFWRPAAAFVVFKPSLAPLALFGFRDRHWWIVGVGLCLVSLAFLPMDIDWVRVIVNARGERAGLLHSLRDVPFVAIGLIAWAGRRSRPSEPWNGLPLLWRLKSTNTSASYQSSRSP